MRLIIILILFILVFSRLGIRGIMRLIGNVFLIKVIIPLVFFGAVAAVLLKGLF